MSRISTQNTLFTASEGGIPPGVQHALHLIGADEQAKSFHSVDRDATINSIPLEQSPALPLPRNDVNPSWWPNLRRGMPNFRSVDRQIRAAERPLGQNTGEFIFLTFMLSGVGIVSVSFAIVEVAIAAYSLWNAPINRPKGW